jgi:hypothetical protein
VALYEVRRAKIAVVDESKVKFFPYDNFNWISHTFELSAEHWNVTHDEVSALLIIAKLPEGPGVLMASEYASIARFEETAGACHRMHPDQALHKIILSAADQTQFRKHSIIHMVHILVDEVPSFAKFRPNLPVFKDPQAIKPHKTGIHTSYLRSRTRIDTRQYDCAQTPFP